MKQDKRIVSGLLFLFSVALPGACFAQTSATIVGSVRDTHGKPIAGASLEAVGAKTQQKRLAKSEADGSFTIPEIPADTYDIKASCETCSDSSTSVTLAAGQNRTVELTLSTDSATTLVAIDTDATTIDLTSSRLGTNITAEETAKLPVNGRTYAPLALAAPGAVTTGTATFDDIRFQGQSGEQTDIRLDDIDASSVMSAAPGFSAVPGFRFRLQASLDSVDEFRVDSAMYSAAQGGGSGAHVNLVSKSGGPQWHGALFEYLRNDELDARNFFDGKENTDLRMNQFGGDAGGALIKDRLFVFAAGEQLFQSAGFNILEAVPSPAARDRAAPEVAGLLAGIPGGVPSTDPDVNIASRSAVARDNETTYTFRADWVAGPKDRLFARESHANGSYDSPDDTTAPRTLNSALSSDQMVLSWSRTQQANLIHQLTLGLNRAPVNLSVSTTAAAAEGNLVQFGNGIVSPGSLFSLPIGYFGQSARLHGRSYNVDDLVTWIHGAHTIKTGFDARFVRLPIDARGGSVYYYLNMDSFLANEDADATVSGNLPGRIAAQDEYGAFVQDEWRLSPSLFLNFGVRYEYRSATREANDRAMLLDPVSLTFNPVHGGFYKPSGLDFDPRVGLSWAPKFDHGNTVIRMGAGSYRARLALMDTLQPILNEANRTLDVGATFPVDPSNAEGATTLASAFDPRSMQKSGRTWQYSVSLQKALPFKFVAQAAYLGSVSNHLEQFTEANPITGFDFSSGDKEYVRANSQLGPVSVLTNGGNSAFNGMELSLSRRLVDDLTIGASYMWSHSVGDSLGAGDAMMAQNPACLACERGNNDFDIRHTFAANVLYDLPFGSNRKYLRKGVPGALLGGWTTGAILNTRTGLPLNVTVNRPDEIYFDPASGQYFSSTADLPDSAEFRLNTPGGGESRTTLRPDYVAGVNPYIRNSNGVWLNPAAFSIPRPGTYGNLGRNSLRGPGFAQLDLQLSRQFRISEKQSITLRMDAFNLFNHANFANPASALPDALIDMQPGVPYSNDTAPGFGQLVSTVGRTVGLGTSRQLQAGVRFEF